MQRRHPQMESARRMIAPPAGESTFLFDLVIIRVVPSATPHCPLSASVGSTPAARRAGNQAANSTTAIEQR